MVSHHGEHTFHDAGGYGIAIRQVVISWARLMTEALLRSVVGCERKVDQNRLKFTEKYGYLKLSTCEKIFAT